MLGAILVIIIGGFSFIYITLFHFWKMDKLQEYERIKFGREKLKWFCTQTLKSIGAEVEVIYRDYGAFEKMGHEKGVVFIANHVSNFDIPALMKGIPIDIGFVAKKEMEKWPIYSKWMKKSGSVFLDRENPREGIKGIKKAVELVKKGHSIVIFPQGKRQIGIKEGDFKKGSFKLALDSQGIVIPVTIVGSEEIQKPFSKKVSMGKKIRLIIGTPIVLSDLTEIQLKNIHKDVENQVIEAYENYSL